MLKKMVSAMPSVVMAMGLTVPVWAVDAQSTGSLDGETVSFDYGPLTDSECEEFVRQEMERLLGPGAQYYMYFGSEERENSVAPANDIDEYKTEYSAIKSVTVSGKPGGILESSVSVTGEGNYIGWTYTDEGGPSISKGISFEVPYKYITFSFSLGMASDSNRYSIQVGKYDAKPGVKYKIARIDKTYDVRAYIIYKKVYSDVGGNYTWEKWGGGATQKVTNRNFDIQPV